MPDSDPDSTDPGLEEWKQGDYAIGVGGFLFAETYPDEDSKFSGTYDIRETDDEAVVGLIAISQTCDIARRTGGREHVTVCALRLLNDTEASQANSGRRPYLSYVETTDENVFADLSKVMSVSKDLLQTWERQEGFKTQAGYINFAASLERKFGQFAFPDEFDAALSRFKKRVWSRHNKSESGVGKIYRSLSEIRFKAHPDWNALNPSIQVLAIIRDEDDKKREASREAVEAELETEINKIELPGNYSWLDEDIKFMVASTRNLTADDYINSQRADFDYLCN